MHDSKTSDKDSDTTAGAIECVPPRRAMMEHNQQHDPLHNIPPEIVSVIFRFASKPADKIDHFTNPDAITLLDRSIRRCRWPLEVSSVCSRWRSIALGEPRLWTTIAMYRRGETWTLSLELVKQRILRCGALPFLVALWWDTKVQSVDENLASLIEFLCARCTRWAGLLLRIPSPVVPLFNHSAEVTLDLGLTYIDYTDGLNLDHTWDMKHAIIRPRHAMFAGLASLPKSFSWSNITVLSFRCINVGDLLTVISQCKGVKSLDITFFTTRPSHLDQPLPTEPLILPRLVKLSIIFSDPFDLNLFMAFARFPGLRFFVMFCVGDGEQRLDLGTLHKVLEQCKSLRSLYFQNMSFIPEQLLELLSHFQRLKTIRFVNKNETTTEVPWLDALFDRLTTSLSDSPRTDFLPSLIYFHYVGPTVFSWHAVADLLEAHIKMQLHPNHPSPKRLLMDFTIESSPSTTQENYKYIDKEVLLRFLELSPYWMDITIDEELICASLEHHGIDKPSQPMFQTEDIGDYLGRLVEALSENIESA